MLALLLQTSSAWHLQSPREISRSVDPLLHTVVGHLKLKHVFTTAALLFIHCVPVCARLLRYGLQ